MSFDPAAQGWTTWKSVGFGDLTGPFWSRREADAWVYGLLIEPRHLNRGGIVHGGMIATFADIAMGRMAYERIKPRSCATVQLNMHYVAAARLGDFIEARAEVIEVTRSLVFLHGRCIAAKRTIATADGVWKILREGQIPMARHDQDAKD